MMIKVQFDCEEKYYKEICRELKDLAILVIVKPVESYNNYSGLYSGDTSTIDNMYEVLRGYYEEEKVTYFEIGHF